MQCKSVLAHKVLLFVCPQNLLLVQIMMLTALRNTQPKTGYRLELIAMLIGFPVTALRWLVSYQLRTCLIRHTCWA